MSEWGRLDQVVTDLRDGRSGRLSIGYFASAGAAWMPSLVKRLRSEFPDLVLELVLTEVEHRGSRPDIDLVIEPPDFPVPTAATTAPTSSTTSSSRSSRATTALGRAHHRAVRPQGRDVGEQRLREVLRPPARRHGLCRSGLPAPLHRAGPGPLHGDRVRRRGRRGVGACRGSRRAASRPPSRGSHLEPPAPVRHLAALVRDVGSPNPAAERAVALLTDLIHHPSALPRRALVG